MDDSFALRRRARDLLAQHQDEQVHDVLLEAVTASQQLEERWQQAEALCRIAQIFALLGNRQTAFHLLTTATGIAQAGEQRGSPQERLDCASVLWEIAEACMLMQDEESAGTIAHSIQNDWKQRRALQGIDNIRRGGTGSFAEVV